MIFTSASFLRTRQKEILDKVFEENQQVIVQRGENVALIINVTDAEKLQLDSALLQDIITSEQQFSEGKSVTVSSSDELWKRLKDTK